MFQATKITSNNAEIKELEYKNKLSGKMEFYEEEARKMLEKKNVIGTNRNDNIRVLLKSYQVKTPGMNKPELR